MLAVSLVPLIVVDNSSPSGYWGKARRYASMLIKPSSFLKAVPSQLFTPSVFPPATLTTHPFPSDIGLTDQIRSDGVLVLNTDIVSYSEFMSWIIIWTRGPYRINVA